MKIYFLILASITCLSSCSFVARTVNNAKKSQIETESSIHSWLKSQGLDNHEVLSVAPEVFVETLLFYQKRKLIFNRFGKVAELGTNNTGVVCHIRTPDEVRNLQPGFPGFTEYLLSKHAIAASFEEYKKGNFIEETDTAYYDIDSLSKYAYTINGEKASIEKNLISDYIVVIPFAKYYGTTIQTSDIRKFLNAIKKNQYSRFRVYLLNLDRQEWWGKEWNERNKIAI